MSSAAQVFDTISDPGVARLLLDGSVGIIPTDTLYGLAARAADKKAVARLYEIKGREGKPGTIIAASIDQLIDLGLDAEDLRAAEHLWPNPVSVVVACDPAAQYLHQGLGTLPVRIPKDAQLIQLLTQTGPLQTTSANYPGLPSANTVAEAEAYFGNRIDFYVDGGDRSIHEPSTIARVSDGKLEVLRQGAFRA